MFKVHLQAKEGVIQSVQLSPSTCWEYQLDSEHNKPDKHLKSKIESWLESYRTHKPFKEVLPLNMKGIPPFTQRVLNFLLEIPFGTTMSYQDVANQLRCPRAPRAVGGACGRNPFLLLVPCHRVIAKDGTLGGFSSGLAIKRALLDWEMLGG